MYRKCTKHECDPSSKNSTLYIIIFMKICKKLIKKRKDKLNFEIQSKTVHTFLAHWWNLNEKFLNQNKFLTRPGYQQAFLKLGNYQSHSDLEK